jgi:hypothetical protein
MRPQIFQITRRSKCMRKISWTTLAAAAALACASSAFAENAVTREEAGGPVTQPAPERAAPAARMRGDARDDDAPAYSGSTEQTEENLRRREDVRTPRSSRTPGHRSTERAEEQRLREQRRNDIN